MKLYGSLIAKLLIVAIIYEIVMSIGYFHCERKTSKPLIEIMEFDPNPH
jgi:hypothetical protein